MLSNKLYFLTVYIMYPIKRMYKRNNLGSNLQISREVILKNKSDLKTKFKLISTQQELE